RERVLLPRRCVPSLCLHRRRCALISDRLALSMLCSYGTFALTPPSYPRSWSAGDRRPTRSTYRVASALSPSRMWHITWVCARMGRRWGDACEILGGTTRWSRGTWWSSISGHDHRRLQQMPNVADEVTWRQYARCYILLFIGGYLMPDTSSNLVHIRWVPLLRDLDECAGLSGGALCSHGRTVRCAMLRGRAGPT
ncbi:hypothetical protein PIB30_106496, partial [Stylosanthes scabra]|nr:hypothetical protein [Stylosanthes scabra]